MNEAQKENGLSLLQQGRLYYERMELTRSIEFFLKAQEIFEHLGDHHYQVETTIYLLRIYTEKMDWDLVSKLEKKILDLVHSEVVKDPKTRARCFYVLDVCNNIKPDQTTKVLYYYNQAIDVAVKNQDTQSMMYPIYGKAVLHYSLGEYAHSLEFVEKLKVLLEFHVNHELQASVFLLLGQIYRNQENFELAIETIWQAYDIQMRINSGT